MLQMPGQFCTQRGDGICGRREQQERRQNAVSAKQGQRGGVGGGRGSGGMRVLVYMQVPVQAWGYT